MRSTKNERKYRKHRQANPPSKGCDFCALVEASTSQVVTETDKCLIIRNLFGYDVWDSCGLEEHMMIIPKRHVASLAELNEVERADYLEAMSQYNMKGYALYARSPGNVTGSMVHQHTHLMKIDNKRKKWLFYVRKPYMVWTR